MKGHWAVLGRCTNLGSFEFWNWVHKKAYDHGGLRVWTNVVGCLGFKRQCLLWLKVYGCSEGHGGTNCLSKGAVGSMSVSWLPATEFNLYPAKQGDNSTFSPQNKRLQY